MPEDIVDRIDGKLQDAAEKIMDRFLGEKSPAKKDRSIHQVHAELSPRISELESLYRMFEKAPPDARQLAELEDKEAACLKLAKEMNAWVAGYVKRYPPKAKKVTKK